MGAATRGEGGKVALGALATDEVGGRLRLLCRESQLPLLGAGHEPDRDGEPGAGGLVRGWKGPPASCLSSVGQRVGWAHADARDPVPARLLRRPCGPYPLPDHGGAPASLVSLHGEERRLGQEFGLVPRRRCHYWNRWGPLPAC